MGIIWERYKKISKAKFLSFARSPLYNLYLPGNIDYSAIKIFPSKCFFGDNCLFGDNSFFDGDCMFGANNQFGKNCIARNPIWRFMYKPNNLLVLGRILPAATDDGYEANLTRDYWQHRLSSFGELPKEWFWFSQDFQKFIHLNQKKIMRSKRWSIVEKWILKSWIKPIFAPKNIKRRLNEAHNYLFKTEYSHRKQKHDYDFTHLFS